VIRRKKGVSMGVGLKEVTGGRAGRFLVGMGDMGLEIRAGHGWKRAGMRVVVSVVVGKGSECDRGKKGWEERKGGKGRRE
jgi:hypothetical protein